MPILKLTNYIIKQIISLKLWIQRILMLFHYNELSWGEYRVLCYKVGKRVSQGGGGYKDYTLLGTTPKEYITQV